MRDWKKYGPASVCFWSLILVAVGLCQLTFGAYYIVKLPVFKIASPVWTGFLNMLCGAVLFGLHHKTLELRQKILAARVVEPNSSPLSSWRRACRWGLYLSLCISLFSVLINTANLIICEVGEWQHWLTYVERKKLKEGPLSLFAVQAYRVSSAQIGTAIFIGVVCTSLNLWNLYRQQNSSGADCKSKLATVSRCSSSVASSKKTGSALPTGYDNASWVYGDEVDGVHLHPEPPARRVFMTTSSLEAPAVHLPAQMSTAAVRYATIRRAASILPSLPDNFTSMRNQSRSYSFREDQQSHPIVSIKRSHTVSQAPIPAGFAHRFQLHPEPSSDMSFIHNGLDKTSVTDGESMSIRNEETVEVRLAEAGRKPPLPPMVPNSYVRNSDRIVLRVESFRTHPASAMSSTVERSPSVVGLPVLIHKRPMRNVKRVSSSTQTELSVLKRNSSATATAPPASASASASSIRPSPLTKRLIPLEKPWSTAEDYSPPPKATPELNAMQLSPGYSAGSSSGYSSPRSSNESKSPTPEPLGAHNADVSAESGQSSQSSLNVTVIRIDPTSTSNQIWTKEIEQEGNDRLDHSTPVNRSVSFRQQKQPLPAASVANNNWIYSNLATDYNRSPIIPIPRPVLRYSNMNETWGRSQHSTNSTPSTLSRRVGQQLHPAAGRKTSSVSVERSASLAASEIQRKLDFLHRRGDVLPARSSPVPVHEAYSDSGYQDEDQSWFSIQRNAHEDGNVSAGDVRDVRRKKSIRPSGVALAEEVDELDSTQTLAYLSQLENLARHWKTQLMYKQVELKSSSSERSASPIDEDSFQC